MIPGDLSEPKADLDLFLPPQPSMHHLVSDQQGFHQGHVGREQAIHHRHHPTGSPDLL